ncbi:MAG: hypothetical protein WCI41_03300 [bacterium]
MKDTETTFEHQVPLKNLESPVQIFFLPTIPGSGNTDLEKIMRILNILNEGKINFSAETRSFVYNFIFIQKKDIKIFEGLPKFKEIVFSINQNYPREIVN